MQEGLLADESDDCCNHHRALLTFIIGEKIGRRKSLTLGAVIMAIGAILQASPFSRAQMIAARVIR